METTSKTKNNKNAEQELRMALEELRKANRERHYNRANLINDEVNRIETGLRNVSFGIAMTLITIPMAIRLPETLSSGQLTLLKFYWLSLVLSILSGLIEHLRAKEFFLAGARRESAAERIWSKAFPTWDEYIKLSKKADKVFSSFKDYSPVTFLYLQFLFISIAIVFLIKLTLMIYA